MSFYLFLMKIGMTTISASYEHRPVEKNRAEILRTPFAKLAHPPPFRKGLLPCLTSTPGTPQEAEDDYLQENTEPNTRPLEK